MYCNARRGFLKMRGSSGADYRGDDHRLAEEPGERGLTASDAKFVSHISQSLAYLEIGGSEVARRMGGAQRYPSIAVGEVDGFREGLNPSYALRCSLAEMAHKRTSAHADIRRTKPGISALLLTRGYRAILTPTVGLQMMARSARECRVCSDV
jgi:hypothetical protein